MRRMRLSLAMSATLLVLGSSASATWGSTGATEWGNTVSFGKQLIPTGVSGISGISAVSASRGFPATNLALTSGVVQSWGSNTRGQLGSGACCTSRTVPEAIPSFSNVIAISAGRETGLAIKEGGTVWAWGTNVHGELGQGTISGPETCKSGPCSTKPIQVPGLEHVVGIAAGSEFDLAVTESGTVYAWGLATSGQLGDGSTEGTVTCGGVAKACEPTPQPVKELEGAVAVATGALHGVALLGSGTVKAWGANEDGQLGNGTTELSTVPVSVSGLSEATAIAAAADVTLALRSDGTARSWGANTRGALGVGRSEAELGFSDVPLTVGGFSPLKEATGISTANGHSLALLSNGTMKGWGFNYAGQVGGGFASEEVVLPTAVVHAKEVSGISAGGDWSLTFGGAAPSLSFLFPAGGSSEGGNVVEIHGANFTEVETVEFGNKAASFEVVSSTLIRAVAPASTPSKTSVSVIAARGQGVPLKYRYTAPGMQPELGRCVKTAKEAGKFKTNGCTEEAPKSSFEWHPDAVLRGFSGSSTETVLETVGKAKVNCKSSTMAGEYDSPQTEAGVKLALLECEKEGAGKCSTPLAAEGEIVTHALEGVLGFESKELNNVAYQLQPEGGGQVAEFNCGATNVKVRGAVVAQWSPPNNMRASFNVKFKQGKGKQKPESLEGGPTAVLEASIAGGAYEQMGLSSVGTVTNEEEVEINTVL